MRDRDVPCPRAIKTPYAFHHKTTIGIFSSALLQVNERDPTMDTAMTTPLHREPFYLSSDWRQLTLFVSRDRHEWGRMKSKLLVEVCPL